MAHKKTFFLDQGEFLGGAERFLIDFLKNLNFSERKKINPVLVGGQTQEYRKLLNNTADSITFIPFNYPSVSGGLFVKFFCVFTLILAGKRLKKLAKKERATQFFSNTPRTHFVMFLAKKIFRLKGRWICIFHDFTTRPNFLLRMICDTADVLVVNSMPTRNFLRSRVAESNFSKMKLVENGVDFEKLPDSAPTKKIESGLIIGRIDPRKGQWFALKAAQLLVEQEISFPLSIVGSPVETDKRTLEYEQKIKQLVANHRLPDISFSPEVSDPFAEMAKHDMILVLPTEPETFGRVVIEALALGKLVLSFDETGPREILQNFYQFLGRKNVYLEKNPFLVTAENEQALAERIYYFLENPTEVEKFCAYASEFVRENYDLSETKKRFFSILAE